MKLMIHKFILIMIGKVFGTVENLGWGDVECGPTKIFYTPSPVQY